MLWGVESIHLEPGLVRWTIATDTPVGRVRFMFPVRSPGAPEPNKRSKTIRGFDSAATGVVAELHERLN